MAFQRGDDSEEASVGSMLLARGLLDLRDLGALARGFGAKKGRR